MTSPVQECRCVADIVYKEVAIYVCPMTLVHIQTVQQMLYTFRQSLKTFLFSQYYCVHRIRGFYRNVYINSLLTLILTYNGQARYTLCSEKNIHSRVLLYHHAKRSDFHKIFRECLGENNYSTGKKTRYSL